MHWALWYGTMLPSSFIEQRGVGWTMRDSNEQWHDATIVVTGSYSRLGSYTVIALTTPHIRPDGAASTFVPTTLTTDKILSRILCLGIEQLEK